MHQDPHDELMLTDRPTTVVTQATGLYDRMPTLYGSVQDEEKLFKGIRRPVTRKAKRRIMGHPVAKTSTPKRVARFSPRGMFEGFAGPVVEEDSIGAVPTGPIPVDANGASPDITVTAPAPWWQRPAVLLGIAAVGFLVLRRRH